MNDNFKPNRPGQPANTSQRVVPPTPPPIETANEGDHRQTGEGTAPPELDVVDPHPSDEGDPYNARHTGGSSPPTKDIGSNPGVHAGTAPPRPRNAESDPTKSSAE